MRRVAVEATLAYWSMLEQEGATLFRVTLVARLVDRVGFQQRVGQGAMRIVAVVAAHLPFGQRHVRAPIELLADVPVALCAGIGDRGLRHQSRDRKFGHRVMAVAARQTVALMHRAEPVIASASRVARETSLCLRLYRCPGILRVADNETLGLRMGGVCGAGTMASLANRDGWIGAIGHVQTQSMQGVGEVIGLELVAGNAGFLADRPCVRRLRIRSYVRVCESRRRSGPIA